MTQDVVEYFFTPVSPWTYLGHPRFAAIASIYGVTVQMKPCDLGKVFSVSGGLPLKDRARQRQDYRLIELARWSKYLGTALNLPILHLPQLLGLAMGIPSKELGLARHLIPVDSIIRRIERSAHHS